MSFSWTDVQKKRLAELNFVMAEAAPVFATEQARDQAFKQAEVGLVRAGKEKLAALLTEKKRPALCEMETRLAAALTAQGFVQVTTPVILAKGMLAKMTIDDRHALFSQVFWLDDKKCLRPMLAPNLYYILKDLVRLWPLPVRIFEIGSCFRKESQGNHHLNEFTMLNLVEWGLPAEARQDRIAELAAVVMAAAGIDGYRLELTSSVVYGDTVDVLKGDLELASGAMGPHFLDGNWGMSGAWVGLGFGLERLAMLRSGGQNVRSVSKSISYLDGVRLNI
ncbi:pyrrolysine--tRNA(Pyl) ligase large subunit [Methylomusa anaerophila]|uniref:Pyrolysyl-tRNA synthetase n=1 Tax=Methylomusa anaerophila TaxID=1930071 RepID=A0A348AJN4_9FIRM|nr:pyrrolysine--tRNA(Pyl) ligase large subunit [Methylomusa anaerophila]BBB91282.1 pyrolysyl-tRNA synthetase [Methylomusa anaerophila]